MPSSLQFIRNWPDFRYDDASEISEVASNHPKFMVAWCHGATGIGRARLACLEYLESDPTVLDEIEFAIATARTALTEGRDHLCCGLLGRVDFLLQAALTLNKPALLEEARCWATAIIQRKGALGHWALGPRPDAGLPIPGLMQGLAGVGLELLRIAEPQRIQSVLLL